MANNIPVFEFGKDSYILRHKIDYNQSGDEQWSAVTYGILFTDYDIARKSNSSNAENFDPIVIEQDINNINTIKLKHYDEEYILGLYGHWTYTELVLSGNTLYDGTTGSTFINNRKYQEYYVESGSTSLFEVGDYFNIYFYGITEATGTTEWSHLGPAGEIWVATGVTDNGIPWNITGTTTINGYSTGTTIWSVLDYIPVLKYSAKVIEVGVNYLKFERKLQDNNYNDLMKIASSNNFEYLYYKLESLEFADRSYYGVKYILEETIWSDYFIMSATNDQLIIEPTPNKSDLYFDYDNVEIVLQDTGGTEYYYYFETKYLYTKYKLDRFLEQLGFGDTTKVSYDHLSYTTSNSYSGETEFDVVLVNSDDIGYFSGYTYIYATGSTTTDHICLIKKISGTTLTLLMPTTGMTIGETIDSINNMYTIHDISQMLYECFINIEST